VVAAVVGACAGAWRAGADEVVGALSGVVDVCVAAVVLAAELPAAGAPVLAAADGVAGAAVPGALACVLFALVFPGSAWAYPPASTTAPAADATVIQPVAVRTRRSPRSRASTRFRASSVVRCGKVGLLGRFRGRRIDDPQPSLTDHRFGICKGNVQIR
jgi:hypothetical protein